MVITIYDTDGAYYRFDSPREVIITERKTLTIESDETGFYIKDARSPEEVEKETA